MKFEAEEQEKVRFNTKDRYGVPMTFDFTGTGKVVPVYKDRNSSTPEMGKEYWIGITKKKCRNGRWARFYTVIEEEVKQKEEKVSHGSCPHCGEPLGDCRYCFICKKWSDVVE